MPLFELYSLKVNKKTTKGNNNSIFLHGESVTATC